MKTPQEKRIAALLCIACLCALSLAFVPHALSGDVPDPLAVLEAGDIGKDQAPASTEDGNTAANDEALHGNAETSKAASGESADEGEAGGEATSAGEAAQVEAASGAVRADEGQPPYEKGAVLVSLASGVTTDEALAAFAEDDDFAGIGVMEESEYFVKLSLPDSLSVEEAVAWLPATGMVETVEPDYYLQVIEDDGTMPSDSGMGVDGKSRSAARDLVAAIQAEGWLESDDLDVAPAEIGSPNDPYYVNGDQWSLPSIHAEAAWNILDDAEQAGVASQEPVVVAVFDNGFYTDNADIVIAQPNDTTSMQNSFVYPATAGTNPAQATTYAGLAPPRGVSSADHGTHVAGIIGAATNNGEGVAAITYNRCRVMPVRLSDSSGTMQISSLERGLSYVKKKRQEGVNVRVVNMSIGVPNLSGYAQSLQNAITDAYNSGIVTVAAACNTGGLFPSEPPFAAYPSDCANVVSVINLARQSTNSDGVARDSGSNYNETNEHLKNISAPGTGIFSTSSTQVAGRWYVSKNGTSMASPLVAGVLGLMFAVHPSLTSETAVSRLYSSARDLTQSAGTSVGWDRATGFGEVDAAAAVADTPAISGPANVVKGTTQAYSVVGSFYHDFTWSSSDPSIASVDSATGELTAVAAGTITLTATGSHSSARQSVRVCDLVGADIVAVGMTESYAVETFAASSFSWSVTAEDGTETDFATIDAATGVLTAQGNIPAGEQRTVMVSATLKSDESVKLTKTVTIIPNEMRVDNTRVTFGACTYNGTWQKPVPTVVLNGKTLKYGTHFSVSWSNNLNAGTAAATITGIAPITGSVTSSFSILKAHISNAAISLNATRFDCTGAARSATVTAVRDIGQNAGITYVLARDYVTSARAVVYGSGSVTITASSSCKNFTGSVSKSFTVVSPVSMYRLYNSWTGEHFYTANASERNDLVKVGWTYEGVGWYAPTVGSNVYRLYNRWSGDHHFTMSASEKDACVKAGWTYEGVGWKSGGSTVVYREYNPYAKAFYHNHTANASEHKYLCSIGWKNEGAGWSGV